MSRLFPSSSAPVFKGPETARIPVEELKKIQIDIHRNIATTAAASGEIERDIVNPDDIAVARKHGNYILLSLHMLFLPADDV